MTSYTNISIFGYDLIVQKLKKPFEVRVAIKKDREAFGFNAGSELEGLKENSSMPSNQHLEKILHYLSEEGFLDDGKGLNEDSITWMEGEPKMRLAIGYLPSHKFKQLKHKIEKHHG
jgi:hypothetical protein